MPEIVIRRKEKKVKPMWVMLGTSRDVRIFVEREGTGTVHVTSDGEGNGPYSIEAELAEGASLVIVTIASCPVEIMQRCRVGAHASILWQNVTMAGGPVVQNLTSELVGECARSNIEWVFSANENARHDLSARNIFHCKDGGGEITVKGVTQDRASARIKGTIDIAPSGGGTQTFLRADALMLDRTAKVDIVPALEIKTNDVKASHAATVSRVTEEELFYFASRGIVEESARRMYILGFLGELVGRITNRNVKNVVQSAIWTKLDGHMERLLYN